MGSRLGQPYQPREAEALASSGAARLGNVLPDQSFRTKYTVVFASPQSCTGGARFQSSWKSFATDAHSAACSRPKRERNAWYWMESPMKTTRSPRSAAHQSCGACSDGQSSDTHE